MKKKVLSKRIMAALLAAGMTVSLGVCSVSATEYPLTITTYGSDGKEMETTYEKAPEKVLAVYQGSIETVTMLQPDMIFSWGSIFGEKKLGDAAGWVEKGTNIYMNTNTRPKVGEEKYNKTLENEYTDILNIGKIFDVEEKAEAIVNEMKDTIKNVVDQTADMEEKPTVLILESYDDSYSNYNTTSLGGDMVTQLGGVLANPNGGSLGKEDVLAVNPDVIFVVYMPYTGDDPEALKQEKLDVFLKDEAFASLNAVKNGRVVPIMLSEMYASATRTQDGIITFAKGLYPELVLE